MRYGHRNSGLVVKPELAEQTIPGDLVLDPMGGSCTTAVVCLKLGRRFIVIDQQPLIHDIAAYRLQQVVDYPKQRKPCGHVPAVNMIDMTDIPFGQSLPDPYIWDNGDSWVVKGDCYQVMHLIPDGIVDLIYVDPPYATGKTFKGKLKMPGTRIDGVEESFGDKWEGGVPLPERPGLEGYVSEYGDEEGLRRWRADQAAAQEDDERYQRVAEGMSRGRGRQPVYCRHCWGVAWHPGAMWGRDRYPLLDDPFGIRRTP